jgi:hypothetical protein
MLALMLNWLLLSIGGAVYLLLRLGRDWRAAWHRVSVRVWFMRFRQGTNRMQRTLGAPFPPHPRWLREGKR